MAMLNSQRVYSWENHEFWGALFSDNPFSMHWYADGFSTLEQMGRIKLQYTTRTWGLISYHIISHKRSWAVRHRWNIDIHWPHTHTHIYIYISAYVKPLAIQVAGSSCFIPESHGSVWPMKHCITQWTWTFVSLATIKNEHCHCVLTFRWIVAHVWPFIFPLQGCSSRFLNWICPQSP